MYEQFTKSRYYIQSCSLVYTHGNTAYYACLVYQLVVIVCFFDLDLDFSGVPVSHTLVHPSPWGEGCPTRSHWTVTKR